MFPAETVYQFASSPSTGLFSVFQFYLITFVSLGTVNAIHILGIFPYAVKSHYSCNYAILKSLHAAGHRVTMITSILPEDTVENFTCIDSRSNDFSLVGQSAVEEWTEMSVNDKLFWMITLDLGYCYEVLKLPAIQTVLESSEKLYDIVFVEILTNFECFLPIAEKLGVPVIGTVTMNRHKLAGRAVGLPNNPAVLPLESTAPFGPQMSMLERAKNLWSHLLAEYYFWRMRNRIDAFYREYYDQNLLYRKGVSLVFNNNHHSLLPRLSVPNSVDIGGIHISPANKLPKDIQAFIDGVSHGVILFSLGSVVKGSPISPQQKRAFLTAFASVSQRVIWKFEERLEDLPANAMTAEWLPQRDILEHKNVIVFMSHCGQSGTYEAVMTGTPVVTIPLYSDQHLNAANLRSRGVGANLNLETITKEAILDALDRIINDTSYYQRMQELSRVFLDRPMTPAESVVYWTECVVKHDGAPHLKALGADMPLHRYLMLDIILLALLLISLIIYATNRVSHKILSLLPRPKQKYV